MSKLGTFAIQNMPLAQNVWKEIGSSFDNVAQALDEHGYGLKHALAYIEGNGNDWEICTRDEEDRLQDRYRSVKPPYAFGDGAMQGSYEGGWVGTLGATGTVIPSGRG